MAGEAAVSQNWTDFAGSKRQAGFALLLVQKGKSKRENGLSAGAGYGGNIVVWVGKGVSI